jgi:hypothetical protein
MMTATMSLTHHISDRGIGLRILNREGITPLGREESNISQELQKETEFNSESRFVLCTLKLFGAPILF